VCEAVAADSISNEQLLELDVDLLIPAALENQITDMNVDRIRAPVIVELANGPITSDADVVLSEKGRLVVPDILANAGGVTVSYFEWVQNRVGYSWTIDDVHQRLRDTMRRAFNVVYDLMESKRIDMRTAAYAVALSRIGEAIESQGTAKFFAGD
jgi:glutamate dehydrogenase (NADP+)